MPLTFSLQPTLCLWKVVLFVLNCDNWNLSPSLENKNGFKKVWTLRTYFKKKCFVKGELCSRKTMSSYRIGSEENIGQEVKKELEVRWLIAVKLSFSSYKRLMWHCRWAEWKLKKWPGGYHMAHGYARKYVLVCFAVSHDLSCLCSEQKLG